MTIYTATFPLTPEFQDDLDAGDCVTAIEVGGTLYLVESYTVVFDSVVFILGVPDDSPTG